MGCYLGFLCVGVVKGFFSGFVREMSKIMMKIMSNSLHVCERLMRTAERVYLYVNGE